MSEPVTTATATESGGPAIEPPSIGGAAQPFEGLDGKRYEGPPPAAAPRVTRRRRVAPAADEGLTPADGPPTSAAPTPTPATPAAPQDTRPGVEALRHPGEDDRSFFERIHQEDRVRIQAAQRQQQELTERSERALREAAAEIQRLRTLVEPVARRQAEQEELRQREELMSQIPDPEAGPEERERYNTLVLQAILQRQREMEQQVQRDRQSDQQKAQERQQMDSLESYLADRDESIQAQMAQARAADPALGQMVDAHLQLTAEQFRRYDPTASAEDIEELVYLTHLDEMVQAYARGISPADYYRQQWAMIQQTAQTFGMQPVQAPVGPPPSAPQMGSPTAASVAREAIRSGTATGGPGRPGGQPGDLNLPTRIYASEDQYIAAGLKNQFDENWIQKTLGKPVGENGGRRRR